jgi:hypothetical protein
MRHREINGRVMAGCAFWSPAMVVMSVPRWRACAEPRCERGLCSGPAWLCIAGLQSSSIFGTLSKALRGSMGLADGSPLGSLDKRGHGPFDAGSAVWRIAAPWAPGEWRRSGGLVCG